MDRLERKIIQQLDLILKDKKLRDKIDSFVEKVENNLKSDPSTILSWEPVPLELFQKELPGDIRSNWVFVMRAGTNTGPERHPNSHQRMMSYRGSGDFPIFTKDKWHSNFLTDDPDADIKDRWVSIPPDTWHYGIVSERNWAVVSFHTVPAEELIEERPDPEDESLTKKMLYISR